GLRRTSQRRTLELAPTPALRGRHAPSPARSGALSELQATGSWWQERCWWRGQSRGLGQLHHQAIAVESPKAPGDRGTPAAGAAHSRRRALLRLRSPGLERYSSAAPKAQETPTRP